MRIRIATRKSPLAVWQAERVRALLQAKHPGLEVELVRITTTGDKILDAPLAKIGGKGLFTKEIEQALLDGRADLAVHSMKDVPTEIPKGLVIRAIPERDDVRDVLVSRHGGGMEALPIGARIGTSSLRRTAQLRARWPQFEYVPIRGNVGTRLAKVEKEVDAVVLAAAGLKRLGLWERATHVFSIEELLPAVAQGALGIEVREDDARIHALVDAIHDEASGLAVNAERAFLRRLEGGCQAPIAAHAHSDGEALVLDGMVAELDGSVVIRRRIRGRPEDAEALGQALADEVLQAGGRAILDRIYGRG